MGLIISPTQPIKIHPLADLFPRMSPQEHDLLTARIEAVGVRKPVTLWNGELIDGRHRLESCRLLKIDCPAVEYTGDDPANFVADENLRRRDLTMTQRAFAVSGLHAIATGRLTAEQVLLGHDQAVGPQGRASNGQAAGPQGRASVEPEAEDQSAGFRPEDESQEPPKLSQAQMYEQVELRRRMAEQAGVSDRMVKKAGQVTRDGIPELVERVKSGVIGITAAVAISQLDPEQQREVLANEGAVAVTPPRKERTLSKREMLLEKKIAELQHENKLLVERYNELVESSRDVAIAADAAQKVIDGEGAQRIIELEHELRAVVAVRNDLQNQVGEMRRQIAQLSRRLEKYEPKGHLPASGRERVLPGLRSGTFGQPDA